MEPIFDLRVFASVEGGHKVYCKTKSPSRVAANVTVGEAALMIAAYRTGRACYWDDERFATYLTQPEAVTEIDWAKFANEIRAWEVAVTPSTGVVDFYLGFATKDHSRSSGLPDAIVWLHFFIPGDRGSLVFELLQSKYSKLSNGVIGNSDIGSLAND